MADLVDGWIARILAPCLTLSDRVCGVESKIQSLASGLITSCVRRSHNHLVLTGPTNFALGLNTYAVVVPLVQSRLPHHVFDPRCGDTSKRLGIFHRDVYEGGVKWFRLMSLAGIHAVWEQGCDDGNCTIMDQEGHLHPGAQYKQAVHCHCGLNFRFS